MSICERGAFTSCHPERGSSALDCEFRTGDEKCFIMRAYEILTAFSERSAQNHHEIGRGAGVGRGLGVGTERGVA